MYVPWIFCGCVRNVLILFLFELVITYYLVLLLKNCCIMERYSRNDDGCPQLLDLISKESREWLVKREYETRSSHGCNNQDEKKLELSLGPPGGGDWTTSDDDNNSSSDLFSFGYFSNITNTTNHHKFSSSPCPWPSSQQQQPSKASPYFQLQSTLPTPTLSAVKPKDSSSQPCCAKGVDLQQSAEKKAFSPAAAAAAAATAVVPNSAQKRTAPAPVVGWPPIRSFRKNLASSSTSSLKSASETPNVVPNKVATSKKPIENSQRKGLFVKINMDCIPIGRKVDLNAYDSYEKLSSAVDELFRGLLAAQSDSSAGGTQNKDEGEKAITGLLDGSGEYTLVYEDNEGDRMLVGDVPWHMFVSTVKRLRVLKSSELPMLSRGSKHGKRSLNS